MLDLGSLSEAVAGDGDWHRQCVQQHPPGVPHAKSRQEYTVVRRYGTV